MSITCKYCGRPKLGGDKGWRKDFKDTGIVCGECLGLTPDTSTPQSSQTCENCRFFDVKLPDDEIAKLKAKFIGDPDCEGWPWWIEGECHESSPYVYRDKREKIRSKSPESRSDKWCGKWQQKGPK